MERRTRFPAVAGALANGTAVAGPAAGEAGLRDGWAIVGASFALLAWDLSGLDWPLVQWYGDATGFAWRNHWLTGGLMHTGVRAIAWIVFGLLLRAQGGQGMARRHRDPGFRVRMGADDARRSLREPCAVDRMDMLGGHCALVSRFAALVPVRRALSWH
jgi:hypothetical protein